MNCEQFQHRFQDHLDHRRSPECDPELAGHVAGCRRCAADFQAWRDIASVMESATCKASQNIVRQERLATEPPGRISRRTWNWGIALAAAVLLAGWMDQQWRAKPPRDSFSVAVEASPSATVSSPGMANHWIDQLPMQRWLSPTIPTVRSVREGVAPLGRSLVQAAAILSAGAGAAG